MTEITLQIDGMHCGACVQRVSKALAGTSGLTVKEVRVGAARIEASEPGAAEKAVEAITKAGYQAHTETVAGR